jgi:hypothetical protein
VSIISLDLVTLHNLDILDTQQTLTNASRIDMTVLGITNIYTHNIHDKPKCIKVIVSTKLFLTCTRKKVNKCKSIDSGKSTLTPAPQADVDKIKIPQKNSMLG